MRRQRDRVRDDDLLDLRCLQAVERRTGEHPVRGGREDAGGARLAQHAGGPEIEEIVVTDTIPLAPEAPDKIKVLSVADILARSIRSIFTDGSVSELFAGENQLF